MLKHFNATRYTDTATRYWSSTVAPFAPLDLVDGGEYRNGFACLICLLAFVPCLESGYPFGLRPLVCVSSFTLPLASISRGTGKGIQTGGINGNNLDK